MSQNKDYKEVKNPEGTAVVCYTRKSDGAYIPKDVGNRDYQEFLAWAKTNTVEAAA